MRAKRDTRFVGGIAPPATALKRVLFVCIGNICRSPMAQALANQYGSDVLVARSAGLAPAYSNAPQTRATLKARGVDMGDHVPRSLSDVDLQQVDLIVNMSGRPVSGVSAPVIDWPVRDPIGQSDTFYEDVCNDIEMLVMRLILQIRSGKI